MKNLKKFLKNNYIKILLIEILLLSFSTIIIGFNLKTRQKNVDAIKGNIAIAKEENVKEQEEEQEEQKEKGEEENNSKNKSSEKNQLKDENDDENESEIKSKDEEKDKDLELISSYITRMTSDREKEKNRVYNIKRAAEYVNGIELKPNEEFSFYETVWAKNKSKSYKDADTITQNGMDKGLGGGICQVASTLFVAALKANLKITQRNNHSRLVSYIPLGLDASYYTGVKDLKFKNNLKNKIKIKADYTDKYIKIKILGKPTKEEKKVKVVIYPAKITKETSKELETNVLVEKEVENKVVDSINFKSSYLK